MQCLSEKWPRDIASVLNWAYWTAICIKPCWFHLFPILFRFIVITCTIFISAQCGTSIVQLFTILSMSASLSQISSKPVFSVILPILPWDVIIIGITRLCAIWRRDTNVGLTFGDSWYAELRHNPQITEQVHRIWQAYSDDPPPTFNSMAPGWFEKTFRKVTFKLI